MVKNNFVKRMKVVLSSPRNKQTINGRYRINNSPHFFEVRAYYLNSINILLARNCIYLQNLNLKYVHIEQSSILVKKTILYLRNGLNIRIFIKYAQVYAMAIKILNIIWILFFFVVLITKEKRYAHFLIPFVSNKNALWKI